MNESAAQMHWLSLEAHPVELMALLMQLPAHSSTLPALASAANTGMIYVMNFMVSIEAKMSQSPKWNPFN